MPPDVPCPASWAPAGRPYASRVWHHPVRPVPPLRMYAGLLTNDPVYPSQYQTSAYCSWAFFNAVRSASVRSCFPRFEKNFSLVTPMVSADELNGGI